jgi:hypothetical protein
VNCVSAASGSDMLRTTFARSHLLARLVLATVSAVGAISTFEIGGRLVLNPADYLSVSPLPDPLLGMTIAPGAGGFDRWGFRNPGIPDAVDVLALGDSHTYGNTARMRDAWPQVLSRETGLSVYNMGLGGYGPNQYYQLLATRGITLRPKTVLVGLYLGDDFENAYSITYGLDYWTFLRDGRRDRVNADIWGDDEPPGEVKTFRNWLSRHSLLYRLTVHGPALATVKASLQFLQATRTHDPSVAVFNDSPNNIHEAFRPIRIRAGLDQERPEVREGMRITFQLLADMARLCIHNGCDLIVVIIPSKETVFADYLRNAEINLKAVIDSLIRNESLATAELETFLRREGIRYVETLPALRSSARGELYYRGPADMHPGANGYKVIGTTVAKFLRDSGGLASQD